MKAISTVHLALLLASVPAIPRAGEKVDFNRDIRPILSDRCFKCHGPDATNQESEFRLDARERATRDLGGYAGISPGSLENSEMHARIRSEDPTERMPPRKSNVTLSEAEKDLLDRWIAQGAPYDTHWAFKPIPGKVSPPPGADWARTPIDAFLLRAMREAGLQPAAEATPGKWLRRVTFDLTGLPPTLEELDAFLADASEEARAQAVDRLLATDAYAERMTSEWLDVARYSDSYGYQVDRDRFVWPWRDWVIRAFRENLPYDRFITRQLAGDLLPTPTRDRILATTFNRLHGQKVEGGSVPEEFRVEYVSDRVHTFGAAFLGLTLECARCHDHKFDPITTREYYQLSSFFANIDEAGLYSYFTPSVPTPTLALPTPDQERAVSDAEAAVSKAEAALRASRASRESREAFQAWLTERPAADAFEWRGLQSHVTFDGREGNKLPDRVRPDRPATTTGNNQSVKGVRGQGLALTGDDAVKLPGVGDFSRVQPFSIGLWVNTPESYPRAVIFRRSRAWTDAASRGYELLVEDGRLSAALVHFQPGNALRVRARDKLPAGEWHHVALTYDGSSRASGLSLYLDGRPLETETVRDGLTRDIRGGGEPDLALGERFRDVGFKNGKVDDLHVFNRELTSLEARELYDGKALRDALAAGADTLSARLRDELYDYFLATASPDHAGALAGLEEARDAKRKLCGGIKEIMVMRETKEPRPCHVLERGSYAARGEKVTAATPATLPPFPAGQPRNRLGLAKWLTSPDHPLTARVTVNRYWQMFFGHGIVRTPEDFGSQGRPPTHPELLDWLARDFIDHGWDLHRLIRQIVLSAAYRQSPVTSPDQRAKDPENIHLSRGTDDRLSAEMIRDNALAVSGLLVRRVGGAPVKPYEVAVSFKPAKPDKGEGLYRRSLYTWWRRTAPAPVMMTLNASKREVCRVRRDVTDSPLQAFVLLNGPQFVEASRVMAAKLLRKHPDSSAALIHDAWRSLTSRAPEEEESRILRELFNEQLAHFKTHPDKAQALLATGQAAPDKEIPPHRQAAAAVLVNAIMNLDESVTKK